MIHLAGTLYGVGVGPGDPSLLTIKAVEIIKKCNIIAAPDTGRQENIALNIIKDYVEDKEILKCITPMHRDKEGLIRAHEKISKDITARLDEGLDICFITLGDPTIYSTYMYIHNFVAQKGYTAKLVPGITSFCAVASALSMSLCEGGTPLHIIPASYEGVENALSLPGTKVLMKSGKQLSETINLLQKHNLLEKSKMVQCCTMSDEKIFNHINSSEIANSYFTTIVVKEENE